jgi:hypothetical protein
MQIFLEDPLVDVEILFMWHLPIGLPVTLGLHIAGDDTVYMELLIHISSLDDATHPVVV